MASLIPDHESFHSTPQLDKSIRVYKVTLLSASDTVTVPTLADANTPNNSVAELDDGNNDTGVTVATSDTTTVTLIGGSEGGKVTFVTLHSRDVINSSVLDNA